MPDACDVCPHLVDPTQGDRDGDGVGDLCDVNADTATERIVLFDPFTEQRPEWRFSGAQPTFDGERLVFGGGFGSWLTYVPVNDVLAIRMTITSIGTGPRQIFVTVLSAPTSDGERYFCQVNDNTSGVALGLIYTPDGMMFSTLANTPRVASFSVGNTVSVMMHHTAPQVACTTSYPVVPPSVFGGPLPDISANEIGFGTIMLSGTVDYAILIHTEP